MKAVYYIRLDTFWQDSPDRWFGPYPTLEAAQEAADNSGAARSDLGQMARDVRYQTRILGIHNATDSRRLGRSPYNTLPTYDGVPGDTQELGELEHECIGL